ncbi:hypothetical protein Ciccas_012937 [Cichlidogyrus casuarinus]|uniref:ferroxidase n=1 Tax=Cichlidogyrus casuarinus TaxID=1844966 RepID=A0ABD2PN07_9PLAT
MEFTGIRINKELEQLIKELIRVKLGAELTLNQLSALCMSDKVNMIHTGEYLKQLSMLKRVQGQKWMQLLACRGGQFKIEQIEILVPVPCKEQLANEQSRQLKIVLDLAMNVEKRVNEMVKKVLFVAKATNDSIVIDIIESKTLPKQMQVIRQIEAQLNTLHRQEVPEYLFEKLTIKPLVENLKHKVHVKLVQQLMTPLTLQQQPALERQMYQMESIFPAHRMF